MTTNAIVKNTTKKATITAHATPATITAHIHHDADKHPELSLIIGGHVTFISFNTTEDTIEGLRDLAHAAVAVAKAIPAAAYDTIEAQNIRPGGTIHDEHGSFEVFEVNLGQDGKVTAYVRDNWRHARVYNSFTEHVAYTPKATR